MAAAAIVHISFELLSKIFSQKSSTLSETMVNKAAPVICIILYTTLELPLAQIAGLLSLAICSIPYLACSLVGCLVGVAQKAKDSPFTNPQELVLQHQDFIALSNVLANKESHHVWSKNILDEESVFDCENIKDIVFKQCHKMVNKQPVVDNQATLEYYQKMKDLLYVNSSTRFTLLPIMIRNEKQWVIAQERSPQSSEQTCCEMNLNRLFGNDEISFE